MIKSSNKNDNNTINTVKTNTASIAKTDKNVRDKILNENVDNNNTECSISPNKQKENDQRIN